MKISPPRARTLRRVAARVAIGVAALFVLYVVVAQILLGGGRLAHLLSEEPETLRVEYATASSWWPGRVHVEGLDVRVRGVKVELALHVDRADASISLWALLARRLTTSRAEAHGVTWRMRLRREDGELTADTIARLPPIDGFPPVPVVDVPPLPAADAPGHPFVLALDGLDLRGVREVWIDTFRLSGDLDVRGGFTIAPHDYFEVRPAHADVHDATLATGEDVLVAAVHGPIDAQIERAVTAESKGAAVLRHLSSRSSLEGRVGGIGFVRHFVPASIAPAGGAGTFRGTLVVDHGVVTKESASHLELGPSAVTIAEAHRAAVGTTTIDVATIADDAGLAGTVTIGLRDVAWTEKDAKTPAVTSASVTLRARIDETDLAITPRDFHYAWDAPATTIADLRVIDETLGKERAFRIEAGTAKMATRGSGSMHALEAKVKVDSNAALEIDDARVTSRLAVDVTASVGFDARVVDLGGSTIDLAELAVRGGAAHPGWTGRVRLENASIHASPPSFDLTFTTSARDARPMLALYGAMKDVSLATRIALAIVPDPAIETATANLVGRGSLHIAPGSVAIHALDVRGASSRARGEWSKHGETKSGGFLFEAGPVAVGLAFDGSGARPILTDATTWFASVAARGGK